MFHHNYQYIDLSLLQYIERVKSSGSGSPFQRDILGLVMCLKMGKEVCSVMRIWQLQIAQTTNDFVVVHCPIHITWESEIGPNRAL